MEGSVDSGQMCIGHSPDGLNPSARVASHWFCRRYFYLSTLSVRASTYMCNYDGYLLLQLTEISSTLRLSREYGTRCGGIGPIIS